MLSRHAISVTAVSVLLGSLACGSGGDTAPGTFNVDFPTPAAAIATSTIQVFAYPTTIFEGGAAGSCQSIIEQRRTGTLSSTPTASSASETPCGLLKGSGQIALPFGNYAFLAVGQQTENGASSDLLLGCAEQTISNSNTVVVIPLSLANEMVSVPTTHCGTLSQSCSSGGSC